MKPAAFIYYMNRVVLIKSDQLSACHIDKSTHSDDRVPLCFTLWQRAISNYAKSLENYVKTNKYTYVPNIFCVGSVDFLCIRKRNVTSTLLRLLIFFASIVLFFELNLVQYEFRQVSTTYLENSY